MAGAMAFNAGGPTGHMPVEFAAYPREFVQPRIQPMEAICLGLPRTGTMSVCLALNMLGVKTYDMTECARDNVNGSTKRWLEAVDANYLNGSGRKMTSRRDLDDLLYRYQGASGMPTVLFPDNMVAAFPNAKIILTETDPDTWVKSMEKSFYSIINDTSSSILLKMDTDYSQYFIPLLRCALRVWTNNDENNKDKLRAGYKKHYAHVREIVPKERILEFDPKEGWEPLCDFLDKPIPKEPFPLVDEDAMVAGLHRNVFVGMRVRAVFANIIKKLIPLLIIGYLIYRILR